MTDPLLRDALRQIQDIVIQVKGSPLDREGVHRVEQVLKSLAAPEVQRFADTGYSRREATILFADLRGFSAIAEKYPPEVVLGVLSSCFGLMTEIIVRHYGTIDKFMGDAIMVVFHGENPSPRDHVQRALLCAVEMQIAMTELRGQHRQDGLPEVYLGIGISTGTVMAGLIGSAAYRAYTVIGEEVNLAARIEAFSLRGQVLMSEATYAHCGDFVQTGEPMEVYVKGPQRAPAHPRGARHSGAGQVRAAAGSAQEPARRGRPDGPVPGTGGQGGGLTAADGHDAGPRLPRRAGATGRAVAALLGGQAGVPLAAARVPRRRDLRAHRFGPRARRPASRRRGIHFVKR